MLKKIKTNGYIFILTALLTIPLFSNIQNLKAETVEEIESKISAHEQQQKNLEIKKEEYLKIIREKQAEQDNLENQIAILDAQESKLEIDIQQTQLQIDEASLEIQKTILKIEKAEREIIRQKEILAELLRTIYKNDQESFLEILLKNNTLSEFLDQVEYIEQIQSQSQKTLNDIKKTKNELKFWKIKQEEKKEELKELKIKQISEKEALETEKEAKKTLLQKTEGEERKFQGLLSRIYQQRKMILGDIERLKREKEKELARLQALQAKPTTGLALENWYYSQEDSRWANVNIGFSKSLMKHYGCAVTCVAMVFKYYGIEITPGQLARQPIFYYDLIVWPKQWRFLDLIVNTKHTGVDWERIDQEIAAGHPVIIFVRANHRKGGHYVVIHSKDVYGRYVVHDPIWGPNIYLDSTRQNIATLYNTSTSIDQMIIYH